jgi:hypothetical protein
MDQVDILLVLAQIGVTVAGFAGGWWRAVRAAQRR